MVRGDVGAIMDSLREGETSLMMPPLAMMGRVEDDWSKTIILIKTPLTNQNDDRVPLMINFLVKIL